MVIDSRRVITLAPRGILPLHLSAGASIECTRGCLWLTEDGCLEDTILLPGDAWQAIGSRHVLVSAFRESSVFSVREDASPRPSPSLVARLRVLLDPRLHPAPGASASACSRSPAGAT